jgi:flagellar biosynthesis chaperone FliJ
MESQIAVLATALIILVAAISFPVVAVLWWRQRRRRVALEEELSVVREAGERAIDISRKLHAERKALTTRIEQMENRYRPIVDLDAESEKLKVTLASWSSQIDQLRKSYRDKKVVYDQLLSEVAVFDEKLAFAEMGVYEPHFEFTDSEEYKRNIAAAREAQKKMVSAKTAVISTSNWTVDCSAAKGRTLTERNIRLTLRAFNSECDAAIANARWNNVVAMEKRIVNARTQIDKHNASNAIIITSAYLELKLRELYLTHEHREKVKAERDERAEAARSQREEQKLLRDMERAEEEEARYQRLLDKAKAEAQGVVGPKLEAFQAQIDVLEKDLAEAHARFERAQAMAERTRSGYVYIVSNVGSFGEDVVKIGLTRRLDPADRVRELGDASVPFLFDTHAIIYSEDAPALERALHAEFDPVRVNSQNYRKEFFRATLDEVEHAVRRLAPGAPFFKDVEAQEYRETLAKRNATLLALDAASSSAFPQAI